MPRERRPTQGWPPAGSSGGSTTHRALWRVGDEELLGAELDVEGAYELLGEHRAEVDELAVLGDVGGVGAVAEPLRRAVRLAHRLEELQHLVHVVPGGDEKVGDILDLVRALAGGQPAELDDAVAEELVLRALGGGGDHGQQVVGTDVDGHAHAAVEREALPSQPLVEQAQLGRHPEQRAGRATRVEGAVAQELLEGQAVAPAELVHLPEEAHHLPHRAFLGGRAAPPQGFQHLGELHEVVHHPVAPHDRATARRSTENERGLVKLDSWTGRPCTRAKAWPPRTSIETTRRRSAEMTS